MVLHCLDGEIFFFTVIKDIKLERLRILLSIMLFYMKPRLLHSRLFNLSYDLTITKHIHNNFREHLQFIEALLFLK